MPIPNQRAQAREAAPCSSAGSKYPALFDAILADSGIRIVRSGVQMPRMNAIMERWVRTCRRELLDRTLIWNQQHLQHALCAYEMFYNQHRPHPGIANARPVKPLPEPITDRYQLVRLNIRGATISAASCASTSMPEGCNLSARRPQR
jgi:hypothetical protein